MAQVVARTPQIPRERRTCTLHRGGDAPAIARIFAKHFLRTVNRADLVDSGVTCISELVTNAIRHTKSRIFVVNMYPNAGSPLFEVWDSFFKLPEWPDRATPPDFEAENGRGLKIVQSLSQDCGALLCRPVPDGGKFVWFRL